MEQDASNVLLTRLDMINVLNSRHIHIPNAEELTYEELLRIFKTFTYPLEKRRERYRCIPRDWERPPAPRHESFSENEVSFQSLFEAQQIVGDNKIHLYSSSHILQQTKYLKLSFNTISNHAPKRYSGVGENIPGPTPPKRLLIHP